jgi:hypothetical protein
MLHWRGRIWPLSAIDGWERVASPWWDGVHAARSTLFGRGVAAVEAALPEARMEERAPPSSVATSIACLSGRLHARIRIGRGFWLFVRWPDRLALPRMEPEGLDALRALVDVIHPGPIAMSSIVSSSIVSDPVDPWHLRCAQAFRVGLSISVLGAWG